MVKSVLSNLNEFKIEVKSEKFNNKVVSPEKLFYIKKIQNW